MADRLVVDGGTSVIAESIPGGIHDPSMIDERELMMWMSDSEWKTNLSLVRHIG